MKGAIIALIVGFILLIISYVRIDIYRSKGTIDVHLHDTYFVLSYTSVVVFLFLFLGTFFSVGGVIDTHFKGKLFWALAIIFLLIDDQMVKKVSGLRKT